MGVDATACTTCELEHQAQMPQPLIISALHMCHCPSSPRSTEEPQYPRSGCAPIGWEGSAGITGSWAPCRPAATEVGRRCSEAQCGPRHCGRHAQVPPSHTPLYEQPASSEQPSASATSAAAAAVAMLGVGGAAAGVCGGEGEVAKRRPQAAAGARGPRGSRA